MTYISWFIDIGLYLADSVMYKAVTLAGGIREPLLTCSSFLKTIAAYDLRVGRCIELNDLMKLHEYHRSRSLFDLRQRSLRFQT